MCSLPTHLEATTMNEACIKRGLVYAFNRLGERVFAFRVEMPTVIGIPDILVNRPPFAAWIEVKYHRAGQKWKLTERQRLLLGRLDGYLVTYEERKDGTRLVRLDAYAGLAHVWWKTITATSDVVPGWPKLHDLVAREIATARLAL